MTKCDFCTKSLPDGKCFWKGVAVREDDCRRAIECMIRGLKGNNNKNLILVDGIEITIEDLKIAINNLNEGEVLELIDVDINGNLHFEINTYGLYY